MLISAAVIFMPRMAYAAEKGISANSVKAAKEDG